MRMPRFRAYLDSATTTRLKVRLCLPGCLSSQICYSFSLSGLFDIAGLPKWAIFAYAPYGIAQEEKVRMVNVLHEDGRDGELGKLPVESDEKDLEQPNELPPAEVNNTHVGDLAITTRDDQSHLTEVPRSYLEQGVVESLPDNNHVPEQYTRQDKDLPITSNAQLTGHESVVHVMQAVGRAVVHAEGDEVPSPIDHTHKPTSKAVHLDTQNLPSVPLDLNNSSITDIAFLDSAASIADSDCPRIQAFAKLEFDDGQFYMNTYSVELGRDVRAARIAFKTDFDACHESVTRHNKRSSSSADATPRRIKHGENRYMESSMVSETGGIMGVDASDTERRRKSKKKSKSTSSSSQRLPRRGYCAPQTDYQSLAMASLNNPQSVDAITYLPSPDECPLIPIHPPTVADGSINGHRGISRRHVKIAYNFEKRLFELEVIGKNGAFVDEQHYVPGEIQELRSGSYIQIGGVGLRFILPDVALGETGAEGAPESDRISGSVMSFDFEDGRGESIVESDNSITSTSEDELSLRSNHREANDHRQNGKVAANLQVDEEEEENDDEEDEEDDEEVEPAAQRRRPTARPLMPSKAPKASKGKSKSKPELKIDPPVPPPKRKGPGRPPKNGIISKREQALIARQAREAAKAEALKNGLSKPSKSGKSAQEHEISNSLQEVKPEKRKYTKRKKAEDQPVEVPQTREMTEKTDSIPPEQVMQAQPPKPVKEKRPPKPPRSPSPVFDEATLTAEQLAKPSQSYVVLIHEALTNSRTGAMSLPQIYRAIERRYPYYKLRVTTTGWQSSVRHNLSQHPAFRKIERDGKGWMWGLVPEISIEKEKKRRPSPPPMPSQQYYGPHMYRHSYPYPGMPPPNGQIPPPMGHAPYSIHPGMPPPPHHIPPNPMSRPIGPNGIPLPLVPQGDTSSTYQSPYQPPPPLPQPAGPSPASTQSQNSVQQKQHAPSGTLSTASKKAPPPPPPYRHPNYPATSTSTHLPPKTSPPAASSQSSSTGSILEMVGLFKSALVASLSDMPNAEEVVSQAINRTLGIPPPPDVIIKEYPEERANMQALNKMLGAPTAKDKPQRQASVPPPPAPPPVQTVPQQQPTPRQAEQPVLTDADRVSAERAPPVPHSAEAQVKLLQLLQHIDKGNAVKPVHQGPTDGVQEPNGTPPADSGESLPDDESRQQESASNSALHAHETASAKALKRGLEESGSSDDNGPAAVKPLPKRVAT